MEGFGPRLRTLRRQRKVPTKDVLDDLGWSRGYLSLIERGLRQPENMPAWDRFERLARRLQVTPEELAGMAGPPGGDERRQVDALRLVFAGLSARPVAAELDALRLGRPETFAAMVPHLVDALEANVVLALRIAGVGPPDPPTGKRRAKRERAN